MKKILALLFLLTFCVNTDGPSVDDLMPPHLNAKCTNNCPSSEEITIHNVETDFENPYWYVFIAWEFERPGKLFNVIHDTKHHSIDCESQTNTVIGYWNQVGYTGPDPYNQASLDFYGFGGDTLTLLSNEQLAKGWNYVTVCVYDTDYRTYGETIVIRKFNDGSVEIISHTQ